MAHDLADLLSTAFREIRRAKAPTQEAWQALSGMSQTWTSDLETGRHGFSSLRKVGQGLEQAGIDPIELFRVAIAQAADIPQEDRDLVTLIAAADPEQKRALLTLLRRPSAAGASAAR